MSDIIAMCVVGIVLHIFSFLTHIIELLSGQCHFNLTQNEMFLGDELLEPKSCSACVEICDADLSSGMEHVVNYIHTISMCKSFFLLAASVSSHVCPVEHCTPFFCTIFQYPA